MTTPPITPILTSPPPTDTQKHYSKNGSKTRTSQLGASLLKEEPKPSKFSKIIQRVKKRSKETNPIKLFQDRLTQHPHPTAHALLTIQNQLNHISNDHKSESRPAEASNLLVEVQRLKLFSELHPEDADATLLVTSFIEVNREPLISIFEESPLHPGFILIYPTEAGAHLTEFTETWLGWLELTEIEGWSRIAYGFRASIGQILTTRLAEIFNLTIDTKSTSEKMKTKTFSEFAAGLKKINGQAAKDLASFFDQLSLVCGQLCTEMWLERDVTPKLLAITAQISALQFQPESPPQVPLLSTARWSEPLSQRSISALSADGSNLEPFIQRLPLFDGSHALLFSVGKALDGRKDTHSGDAARSYQLTRGVTAHLVVDSAGSKKPAFEAAAYLTDLVGRYLEVHPVPDHCDQELVNFLQSLARESFGECTSNGYECTMTFNLLFPGKGGSKLLVGFSAGDTWVFKRTPAEEGRWQIKELTPFISKAMNENSGALGNTVLSTVSLFDVYVEMIENGEQIFFASDALRDCWEILAPELQRAADPFKAVIAPFVESHRRVSALLRAAESQKEIEEKYKLFSESYSALREAVRKKLGCEISSAEKQIDALYRIRKENMSNVDGDYDLRESLGLKILEAEELIRCHEQKIASDKAGKIVRRIENQIKNLSGTLSSRDADLLQLIGVENDEEELRELNKLLSLKRDDLTLLGVF